MHYLLCDLLTNNGPTILQERIFISKAEVTYQISISKMEVLFYFIPNTTINK